MNVRAQVVIDTDRFDDDLDALTGTFGFRVDAISPADSPSTAIVSGHDLSLRLARATSSVPVTVRLFSNDPAVIGSVNVLPGGTRLEYHRAATTYHLPDNDASLVITADDDESGVGRAGMRYRDLLPDRWGGRFISSHITIPEAGPVPDYVHFHKIRFQMIFVKAGWVKVVYEHQGEPFVMHAGDCVLQPPEIRHRVLESSAGLEVIEIGCPAEHETIADWSTELPTPTLDPAHDFSGQRFVHHVAADASYQPWRLEGWEYRDTGIGAATDGLAGVRVARPSGLLDDRPIDHDTEFSQLVVLRGAVDFDADGRTTQLTDGDSVAIPGGAAYRLVDATADCELLDVTLPDVFPIHRHAGRD